MTKNPSKPTILKPTNSNFHVKSSYSALVLKCLVGGGFQVDGSSAKLGAAAADHLSLPSWLEVEGSRALPEELTSQNLIRSRMCGG